MELHQLRYFCAVADSGSFSRAAEQSHVSQPSLSQQILKLEDELGARLFDRLGRSVRLTEVGKTFLPRARAVLRELEAARGDVVERKDSVGGAICVGAPRALVRRLSARVLVRRAGIEAARHRGCRGQPLCRPRGDRRGAMSAMPLAAGAATTPVWNVMTGTVTKYVLLAVNIGLGIGLMPFTIRHLGTAEYGLWIVGVLLVGVLITIPYASFVGAYLIGNYARMTDPQPAAAADSIGQAG